jgi:hypothetical protein
MYSCSAMPAQVTASSATLRPAAPAARAVLSRHRKRAGTQWYRDETDGRGGPTATRPSAPEPRHWPPKRRPTPPARGAPLPPIGTPITYQTKPREQPTGMP